MSAAGSTDGTSVRRLAVACDSEARPSLRLVPPLDEAAEGVLTEKASGGLVPAADERRPSSGAAALGQDAAEGRPPGTGKSESIPEPPVGEELRDAVPGAGALRVCILGDGRASVTFARALAGRLARAPGARCAVLGRLGAAPGASSLVAVTALPAARRVSRALQEGGLAAAARGRLVEITLSVEGAAAELALIAALPEAPPIVLGLPATRAAELDALLLGHDLALLVVRADTPPTLTALAIADLERTTSGAAVRAITLPTRGGGAARRAALNEAMEALR